MVVRDVAAVERVLADDPVAACMVAARVADHGLDPAGIGGEVWTRRGAEESLCFAGANLIPLRGRPADLWAFAEQALSGPRRCAPPPPMPAHGRASASGTGRTTRW